MNIGFKLKLLRKAIFFFSSLVENISTSKIILITMYDSNSAEYYYDVLAKRTSCLGQQVIARLACSPA